MAASFAVTSGAAVEGVTVVVVDDVSTTGATLRACHAALLGAGARRVMGVVLARTPASALGIPLGLDTGTGLDIGAKRFCEFRMRLRPVAR